MIPTDSLPYLTGSEKRISEVSSPRINIPSPFPVGEDQPLSFAIFREQANPGLDRITGAAQGKRLPVKLDGSRFGAVRSEQQTHGLGPPRPHQTG